jgi:hypothetical protein
VAVERPLGPANLDLVAAAPEDLDVAACDVDLDPEQGPR